MPIPKLKCLSVSLLQHYSAYVFIYAVTLIKKLYISCASVLSIFYFGLGGLIRTFPVGYVRCPSLSFCLFGKIFICSIFMKDISPNIAVFLMIRIMNYNFNTFNVI